MMKLIVVLRNFATAPQTLLTQVAVFDLLRTTLNVFHIRSYFVPWSKHYIGFKNLSVYVKQGEVAV